MGARIGPEHLRDLERRRSLRFVLPRPEDITLIAGGRAYRGKLEDVSVGGAKLRLDERLGSIEGPRLEHAAAGTFDAVVMWQDDGVVGVCFELNEPAIDLISRCLRQGVPNTAFAA